MTKRERQQAILDLVAEHRVGSQSQLRDLLARRGFDVTQATLSRDIRELRLVKVPDATGSAHYTLPPRSREQTPPLQNLLPTLFVDLDGAGNLLVLKTLAGGAQPVAAALDSEEWPEVVGTVAGDDTVLIILRAPEKLAAIHRRIADLADVDLAPPELPGS